MQMLGRNDNTHERRVLLMRYLAFHKHEYVTPLCLGGSDRSPHSGDLRHLWKHGLVERKRFIVGVSSGHWRYKLSKKGIEYLDKGMRYEPPVTHRKSRKEK